jgi:hypothetical protein
MINIIESTLPLGLDGYAVSCEDSFMDALLTSKNTVVGNLDYGTDWKKLKHRSYNNSWKIDARRYCKDACSHDPRLTFEDVQFDESEIESGKTFLNIYISSKVLKVSADV